MRKYKIVATVYVDALDAKSAAKQAEHVLAHLSNINVTAQTDFVDSTDPEDGFYGFWYWQGLGNQIKQAPDNHFSWGY